MKKSVFFLASLCVGTGLLSSCGDRNQAAGTAATTTTETAAMPGDSAGGMAGMDHSKMAGGGPASASPQLAAMNDMMAKMDALKPKGNTDHDFAHMMMAHHQGAVAMADLELRDGKDATMRAMATKIKADQQREIGALAPIAERLDSAPNNYRPTDPADPFASKMKASMTGMMQNLPAAVADADMNFNMLMTVHHQSAVDMAQAELAHGKDTKLKEMAQKMVDAQQQEIQQLKDWHTKNGAKMKASAVGYECPMNDGGRSSAAGKCPKCGMDLVKRA